MTAPEIGWRVALSLTVAPTTCAASAPGVIVEANITQIVALRTTRARVVTRASC